MTLTRSQVKVKVTGLFELPKIAEAMHARGDDRQPPCGAFWFILSFSVYTIRHLVCWYSAHLRHDTLKLARCRIRRGYAHVRADTRASSRSVNRPLGSVAFTQFCSVVKYSTAPSFITGAEP